MIMMILLITPLFLSAAEVQVSLENSLKPSPLREITPRLTKEESKEVARKISTILTESSDHVIEKAISRTISDDPPLMEDDELENIRMGVFSQLNNIQDELNVDYCLKEQLSRWALKELSGKTNQEISIRKRETQKKVIASTVALVATVISIIAPVLTFFLVDDCDTIHNNSSKV